MKKENLSRIFTALVAVIFMTVNVSCLKESDDIDQEGEAIGFNSINVPDDFTWRTSMDLLIDITLIDADGNPVAENEISFYTGYPDGQLLLDGESRDDGKFVRKYKVPGGTQEITAVITGQDPIVIALGQTELHNFPALEAKQTITVEAPGLKAFNPGGMVSFFPGPGQYATLVFEDNWPYTVDYDFNDVVIDYNVIAFYNRDGLVKNVKMKLFLRASGAGRDNAFGISFRQSWSSPGDFPAISEVTVNETLILPENTEFPSYILIPSTKTVMPTYNTFMDNPFVAPVEFEVNIEFEEPVRDWDLNLPLQNPFIVINQDRGRELHLPFDPPTSLADPSWVGKGVDASDPNAFITDLKAIGRVFTYLTEERYPWAMDIYIVNNNGNHLFQYPTERTDITEAYTAFQGWVENWSPWDWYMPQYQVEGNVYTKMPNGY